LCQGFSESPSELAATVIGRETSKAAAPPGQPPLAPTVKSTVWAALCPWTTLTV